MDSQKKTAIAGAIGVMVLLLVVGLWPKGDKQVSSASKADEKRAPISALTKDSGIASSIPRRKSVIELGEPPQTDFDPYEEWELKKILRHFMVPPGRFEAADISEAMEMLEAIYAEHSGGRMLDIQVKAPTATDASFAFDHGNLSFQQMLEIVAAISGYRVGIGDAKVAFIQGPQLDPDIEDYSVETQAIQHPVAPLKGDPFAESPPPSDWRAVLAAYGMEVSDKTSMEIDEAGRWQFAGPGDELNRIHALSEALSTPASGVYITQKILKTQNGFQMDPQTFNDLEFQTQIRALSESGDVELVSAPAVITGAGQEAKIEIMREFIYPMEADATGNPIAFDMIPVGMSIPITPVIAGLDRAQIQGVTEFTGFAGQPLAEIVNLGQAPPDPKQGAVLSADSFETHANHFSGQLYDGNTAALLAAEENATGTSVYHFMTVRRIDPSGKPLLQPLLQP